MPLPGIDTLDDLGGALSNLGGAPVENPQTDLDADADNIARANVAAMTHTATRAWVRWTGFTYSAPAFVVPDDHDSLWGSSTGVRPTVQQTSAGVYVVTWPATVTDELGNVHTLNIRKPNAWVESQFLYQAGPSAHTANTVTVRTRTIEFGVANNSLDGIPVYLEIG